MDLPLHDKALAVMAKRDDNYFIPKGHTEIKVGDKLLMISEDDKILNEATNMLEQFNIKFDSIEDEVENE